MVNVVNVVKFFHKQSKKNIAIVLFGFLILFKSYLGSIESDKADAEAYSHHTEVLKKLNIETEIYKGKNVYKLLDKQVKGKSLLNEIGFNCLSNFKSRTSSGGANYFFSVMFTTEGQNFYYNVYGYNEDYFYLAPVIVKSGKVSYEMMRLKFNCHYSVL